MKSVTRREPPIKVTGNLITCTDVALNARLEKKFGDDKNKLISWISDYLRNTGSKLPQ